MSVEPAPERAAQDRAVTCSTNAVSCALHQVRKGVGWIRRHPEPGMVVAFAIGFLIGVSTSSRRTP